MNRRVIILLCAVIALCAAVLAVSVGMIRQTESAEPEALPSPEQIAQPAASQEPIPAAEPSPEPVRTPEPTPEPRYAFLPGAVDLRWYLPEAEFELLFASENNITSQALYPAVPLLEENTALMLKRAFDVFKADGYTLKIYDAYRPRSAQAALWAAVQNSRFIADPAKGGSWHQSGKALDISLVDDATGLELEMPTPMHTFTDEAGRYANSNWSETATANVNYMTEVMRSVGFSTLRTEWWHFENNAKGWPSMEPDIDISALEYLSAQEMDERFARK